MKGRAPRTGRIDWCTPAAVIECVLRLGPIQLDPATNKHNTLNAAKFYTETDDGLTKEWESMTFVNHPYGRSHNKSWSDKIRSEAKRGVEVIALSPASVGAKWFQPYFDYTICFVSGRLQFVGAPTGADFDCAVIYLGERNDEFRDAFKSLGRFGNG